jgi:hypothetical protein
VCSRLAKSHMHDSKAQCKACMDSVKEPSFGFAPDQVSVCGGMELGGCFLSSWLCQHTTRHGMAYRDLQHALSLRSHDVINLYACISGCECCVCADSTNIEHECY